MAAIAYEGRRFPVEKELVLGRWRGCGVQVRDEKASRRHARLLLADDGGLWLEDLDSANGTRVNDERVAEPRQLEHGDRIQVGRAVLVVELDERERISDRMAAVAAPKPKADPAALIDHVVGGCRLTRVIGSGATSTVYRAKQLTTGREVAVKVFTAAVADAVLARVTASAVVKHDSLAALHDAGRDDGLAWVAMELVDGDNLERLIERDGALAPALALLVCERVAQALAAAHDAGVVHGDVNPRAILLSGSGQVKLVDLGLAADGDADPAYAAPDRAGRAARPADDVYALGGVLYHLLAGAPPYPGDDPAELARAHRDRPLPDVRAAKPELPARIGGILAQMLNKNPEWRYATMREIVVDLRAARDELARAVKTAEPPPRAAAAAVAIPPRPRRPRTEPVVPVTAGERDLQRLAMRLLVAVGIALVVAFAAPVFMRHFAHEPAPLPETVAETPPVAPPKPVERAPSAGHWSAGTATAGTATAGGGDAEERWRALQERLAADLARDYWGSAERRLAAFVAQAGGESADAARLRATQLQVEGTAWYRDRLAELPSPDQAGGLPRAAAALSRLRDVALASDRPDAESRYQEVLTRLAQRLASARREARRAVESGRSAELPRLADALAPSFANTPVEGLQRQFADAAREAAAAAKLWQGSWAATHAALRGAKGADALPAAAALLLAGEVAEAKALLAREPATASGDALKRRSRLLGGEAAVLAFDDPADLQFVESIGGGDLVLADGALTAAGDAAGLACTVPVGGATWDVAATLQLGAGDGQAVWSINQRDEAHLVLRFDKDRATLRVHAGEGWIEQQPERPKDGRIKLRIACRDGRIEVAINGRTALENDGAKIPAGSQLRFEAAGVAWRLEDLQVVGGGQ